VIRLALFIILAVVLAKAFWRLVDGVAEGLSGGSTDARRDVPMARDPVCGTFVVPDRAIALIEGRQPVFFCSTGCRDKYRAQAG
jgi:hypothetical protein